MRTDVLVIGGGLAGKRCACFAGKKADVVLISDGGGASPFIHGLNVPLYKDDSVQCFYEDTLRSGKYLNNKKLAETLCEKSMELTEEFSFDKTEDGNYKLLTPLGSTYPRVASINGFTGTAVIKKIEENKTYRHLKGVRALKLKCEKGRVCGAYCCDKQTGQIFFIAAKAVVIASGGFCNIFPFSTNSSDIAGDSIALGLSAGAALCDMEFIQFEPSCAVSPVSLKGKSVITTMLYEGAIIKNAFGKRFIDGGERVDKDVLSRLIYNEILNGGATENGGVYFDATAVDKSLMLDRYSVYYKRYADKGIDILKEPMEIAPGAHTSLGGIEINEKCETGIEGLFACGEAAGGIHGANRLGGNAGLEVMVFGKIAAKSVLRYIKNNIPTAEQEVNLRSDSKDYHKERKLLSDTVHVSLNVIRDKETLTSAKRALKELLEALYDEKISYNKLRMYNDVLCAYTAVLSALERKGSVGCHTRSDSIAEDEKYCIRVTMDVNGIKTERGSRR